MTKSRDTNITHDRTLALAGILQVAALVQQLARHGSIVETSAFQTSIASIFTTDAATVDEVYDGVAGLFLGLGLIRHHLAGTAEIPTNLLDRERIGYFFSLIRLEIRLRQRPKLLTRIGAGIELARNQARHIPFTHPDIVAGLANLYTETISTLDFRIMVVGEQEHLTRHENANLIRALLLAGVRSAVLWQQRGGRWWKLIFQRHILLETAAELMKSLVK